MTSNEHSTHADSSHENPAAQRAEAGTAGWEDAVRLQRWADPDHTDFYTLAGEIDATLRALDDLTGVLHRQITRYGDGRRLYDDTHRVAPAVRLGEAAGELAVLRDHLQAAQEPAGRFWSAIGHVGVEDVTR